MKFGIDIGHNCSPHDTGAVGFKKEDALAKDVGTRLMQKLSAAGHSVINCTPSQATSVSDSLRKRVNKANANQVDVFVSIHFNAYQQTDGPRGAEIYAISNTSKAIARSVLDRITKLGFRDKGVKGNPHFFVIKNTSMPAILIECCFVDSRIDMDLFDAEKMAEAIKVGLIGEGQVDPPDPQPGTLVITQQTILKPSTDAAQNLPSEVLENIVPGNYPVLDIRLEERHYWVKWPDKSLGNRDEHFVFEEHAEIKV